MKNTVAQVIVDALHSWGVKNIYGVSGDALLPFMDILGKQNKIRYFSSVTEQGAAFMACGEARVTGKPGVCLATEGPGAISLLNGVADAYCDGVPVLVITGQVDTGKLGTGAKQYFNQQQIFNPITGMSILLTRPESVVDTFKIAMEKATGDNTPCHISIPKDVFLSSTSDKNDIPVLANPNRPAISGNVEEITNLLLGCRRPLIIAGRASIPYKEAVYRLAESIGAGIIPAQGARGDYYSNDKSFVGGLGEAHIPPLLNRADIILIIGASPYEHNFIPTEKTIIQIDTRPQNLASNLRPLSLTGDLALILELIVDKLSTYIPEPVWQEDISRCHLEFIKMIEQEAKLSDKPISPRQVIAILNKIMPEGAVITIDTGEFMHWFDRGYISCKKQKVIISDFWRSMGSGLLYGLGAQVACPQKKVVVLSGEGGFMMTMQEMITAARYQLPVKVLVFNNGRYILEEHRMQKKGMTPFGVDVQAPDFVYFARACGVEGVRVEEPAKLQGVLVKALSSQKSVVVDIVINTEKSAFI